MTDEEHVHSFVMIVFRRGGEEGTEIVCEFCRQTAEDVVCALLDENRRYREALEAVNDVFFTKHEKGQTTFGKSIVDMREAKRLLFEALGKKL